MTESESPEPRRRAKKVASLSGLDLDPDDDDEYDDSVVKHESDDDRKRALDDDSADEPEEEEEEEEPKEGTKKPPRPKKPQPKRRGRKRTKLVLTEDGYIDEDGNKLNVQNDEIVLDEEDPKAAEKVDADGNLKRGRRFRIKTFTVLGQGDRKYMVSTEPARLVGFRDSYLLFKTHTNLFKKVCTNEEKMDLIDRNIIPNSYKGRSVNLVTARSIYREFGAKILIDGRKVIDDFWEQKARDAGDVEGEYADPTELYNLNMSRNNPTDANPGSASTPVQGSALISYQSDPTWMYQIAMQVRDLNKKLMESRSQTFRGTKDLYTGLTFYPGSTQSTKYAISKTAADAKALETDVVVVNPNLRQKYTGLSTVSKETWREEDHDLKRAIADQVKYENSL